MYGLDHLGCFFSFSCSVVLWFSSLFTETEERFLKKGAKGSLCFFTCVCTKPQVQQSDCIHVIMYGYLGCLVV